MENTDDILDIYNEQFDIKNVGGESEYDPVTETQEMKEERERVVNNLFLLSKFEDKDINVFNDDQPDKKIQFISTPKQNGDYFIFKVNQNISKIKYNLKK